MMISYPHWCLEVPYHVADSNMLPNTVSWQPLWKFDSDQCELGLSGDHNLVYVENRRRIVNVTQRQASSSYEIGDSSRRIIRGTWFYLHNSKAYLPFTEEVANVIESWFQGLKLITSMNGEPIRAEVDFSIALSYKLDQELVKYRLVAVKDIKPGDVKPNDNINDGFVITMRAVGLTDLFAGTIILQRGIQTPLDVEEKWCGSEANHIMFVVHGIGQTFFSKTESNFKKDISSLRKVTLEQQESLLQEDMGGLLDTNALRNCKSRIEILGVEWYDVIRSKDTSLAEDLIRVTLPNIQVVRQLANEVVLDILLYLTPQFRAKILLTVCNRINELFSKFIEHNPNFLENGGKCSVIGHSLGTVILFDLLSLQGLEGSSLQ
jgi:hypothetical protein